MGHFFVPLLLVWLAIAGISVVEADVAFNYASEIVLENALLNTSFDVTSAFTDSVAAVLQSALSAAALTSVVYTVHPHLVVSSEVWYSGTADAVAASVGAINTTYQELVADDSRAMDVSGSLSYLCKRNIGQQPTVVNYTNNCSFSYQALPPSTDASTCLRNLSVTIYSNSSDAVAMHTALCSFLPTSCDLITSATASQVTVTIGGTQVSVYSMPFTITTSNREATLALLVAYAHYASFLVEQKIVYILVDGVRVFYQGDQQQLWTTGTMGQCVQRMWYLIFLIILVPVILIVSQQMFYWGRRSGKRSITKAERDIRAGVHLSAMPWANFGGGGPQYGAQQQPGYPGGYGGAAMQQWPPTQQQQQQQPMAAPPGWGGQSWPGGQFGGPPQAQQQQLPALRNQQYRREAPGQLGGFSAPGPQWSYGAQPPPQPQPAANAWGGYGGGGASQAGWGPARQ